jgi:hypothetical protein
VDAPQAWGRRVAAARFRDPLRVRQIDGFRPAGKHGQDSRAGKSKSAGENRVAKHCKTRNAGCRELVLKLILCATLIAVLF